MYTHGPSCLDGPVTGSRSWWKPGQTAQDGASIPGEEPGFRADLVARVRREIATGTYETPEKWERALYRLLETLARE
jgi:hypothetical protein